MVLDPAAEAREALSPELVLVSSPEDAQRARELLPELPGFAVPVARTAPALLDAAPRTIERPPPPPYPRIAIDELLPDRPRRRKRGLVVFAACLLAVAAAGYFVETRWDNSASRSAEAAPPAVTTAGAGSATVPTAVPHTTPPKPPAHPAPTVTKAAAPATKPSTKHAAPAAITRKAVPAKQAVPTKKVVPTKKAAPTKKTAKATRTVRPAKLHSAPPSASGFIPARTWAWVPSAGGGYEVTFFLDGRTVLHAWPKEPRLVLPKGFRYHAGHYRWTVRAVRAGATGKLIVDGNFVLTPAAAAAANA